jgi:ABC-2 type transport system ATP-binding protein
MKRRVNIAIGVMHQPELLILDEPTTGVDVQSRNAIVGYLKQLNQQGVTLLYTSHHLNEAQELCDTIAMIDHGQILQQGALSEVLNQHQSSSLESLFIQLTGKAYRD